MPLAAAFLRGYNRNRSTARQRLFPVAGVGFHQRGKGKDFIGSGGGIPPSLRRKIEYLFLVSEEGMEGEIQRQLPLAWKRKSVSLTSLDTHDPDHKVLSGALEAMQTISREKAEALAGEIIEEAQPLGRATLGAEPTLSALQNHQIERLVLDSQFNATGWQCQGCGYLGMGGVPRSCPLCQKASHPAELREEIVWRAQSPEIEISFTEDFAPLLKAEGIGALLKFRISGAKSRGVA